MKEILIKCKGSRSIPLNDLQDFQGNLKELKSQEYLKLKNSIIKYGFAFPVIVWKNNIIDGHQRVFALKKMVQEEGYKIKNIPVADIEAENEKEAKHKLLLFNSQYGKISDDGLYEFIETSDLNFDLLKEEISLPDFDLDYFEDSFYNEINIKIQEEDIDYYEQTHILISFPPEKLIEIQNILEQIKNKDYVEYEQSSN